MSGMPSIPDSFIQDNDLVKLNKENLYVYLKDKQNFKKKASRNSYESQRITNDFVVDSVVVPVALEKFAELETSLVAAHSKYSKDQIGLASKVLEVEMKGFGITNPQIRIASSDDKSIKFAVDVPTSNGRVQVNIPVEFASGRPIIPSTFDLNGNIYKLNSESLKALVKSAAKNGIEKVSRELESMERMSHDQLLDRMINGISSGDLRSAEEALSVIQAKFDSQTYLFSLEKFSKLLKHASDGDSRDQMIKSALKNGDMIWLKTSVEPYCPKLGLPASKVDFDPKGRPVPMRKSLRDGLDGVLVNTSKVIIS
jgi:hypothetical protein